MSETVALVGAGLIGRGWAIVFARAGFEVRLWDGVAGAAAKAMDLLKASLADLQDEGLVVDAAAVLSRIAPVATMAEALDGATYVQESVPETVALKCAIYAEMDRLAAPDTLLASSTSAIEPSHFTDGLAGRARCLVAHPANPPHLMPVVELVPAPWTAPETMVRARSIMDAVGQVPVTLTREVPGFVMNRLQAAVVNEAMRLAAEGVMTPDDIDATMRYSIGMRWSFMGPFETMDLNAPIGFKDYCERYGAVLAGLDANRLPAEPWSAANIEAVSSARRDRVPLDAVPARQAWRDRRLAALNKHVRQADEKFGK